MREDTTNEFACSLIRMDEVTPRFDPPDERNMAPTKATTTQDAPPKAARREFERGLTFAKRWGVPEAVWNIGSHYMFEITGLTDVDHAPDWITNYECDRGARSGDCVLERAYARHIGYDDEICRTHITGCNDMGEPYSAAFDEYAKEGDANFRAAGQRLCADRGHERTNVFQTICVCMDSFGPLDGAA
jgi:hypothetical protein